MENTEALIKRLRHRAKFDTAESPYRLLEEAAAALEAVMDGWRPIETAPKDGADILVARFDDDGSDWYAVAQWWVRAWAFMSGRPGDMPALLGFIPTHWMSLPKPPEPRS